MYLSPIVGVPALSAVAIVAAAWFSEPPAAAANVEMTLPSAVYERLAEQAKSRTDESGQPLTVGQFLEALSRERPE